MSKQKNFWQDLPKPIMVLAPMADVTDSAFRQIIAKYSRPMGPDVFYTEFVSADGLCHPEAKDKLMRELYFTGTERPIVAQIFSGKPDKIKQAARLIQDLGFDGLDINMGCPDRAVERQLAGSCLIKHPSLAQEIVWAAKEGAPNLPVAVKTRVGYSRTDELESWAATLLATKPAVLTFHLRTRREMSKVPAHWDLIKIPAEMAKGTDTLIFGNGDVRSVTEARHKAEQYDIDGVMIGRGIFGNPWLFANLFHESRSRQIEHPPLILPNNKDGHLSNGSVGNSAVSQSRNRPSESECDTNHDICKISGGHIPSTKEKLLVCLEHVKLFSDMYRPGPTNDQLFAGHTKSFHIMKKHFKAYVNDFPDASDLRSKLMATETAEEVEDVIKGFLAE